MRTIVAAPMLILVMIACTPDEEPVEAESGTVESGTVDQTEPAPIVEETSPVESDDDARLVQERRERLREAMREHRQATHEATPEMPRRTTLRQQRDRTPWWHDDDLVAALDLDSDQLEAIEQATAELEQARAVARREMVELRRQLARGLSEDDSQQADQATTQRERLQRQLDEAAQHWERAIGEILEPSQLEHLEAEHPEALSAPHARALNRGRDG